MKLKGLATGIGSLPHQDVERALDLVFKYTPRIPYWPQLPRRDVREGMVAQFSENFPCIRVSDKGLNLSLEDKEKELEIFYEHIIAEDLDYFRITPDFASGLHRFYQRLEKQNLKDIDFIKCQVSGPFSFAGGLKDDKGIALLHDTVFMQAISKGLLMKALWQIKIFKKFNKKIILFFDEPYLSCFGSAYTPLNREEVVKTLGELTAGIKSKDILLGVHCCGNTDWSIFLDLDTIDIVSFDAFSFQERLILYADNLKVFFKRGGILCWGIVPTSEFSPEVTPVLLTEKLSRGIAALLKKGIDKELIYSNLFLSPSCGMGTLEVEKSAQILQLLCQLQEKSFDNII